MDEENEIQAPDAPPGVPQRYVPQQGIPSWRSVDISVRRSSDGKRSEIIINTDSLDTYGTVIEPAGAVLERYNRNPIVLINHDPWAVAGNSRVSLRNGQLVATMDDGDWDLEDPFIAGWYRKVKKGFVRGASIRFIPIEWREEKDEARGRYYRITKWELAEWSFVSVPSNADAVVTVRAPRPEASVLDEVRALRQEIATLRAAEAAPLNDATASNRSALPAEAPSAGETARESVPDEAAIPGARTHAAASPEAAGLHLVTLSDLRTLVVEARQARQQRALTFALRALGRA